MSKHGNEHDLWGRDRPCDISMHIMATQPLWDKQCFTTPDEKTTREILKHLENCRKDLEELIDDIEGILLPAKE